MMDVECPKGGRHELEAMTSISNYPVEDSNPTCIYVCGKCQKEAHWRDVERLLNAAMQLTADEADRITEDLGAESAYDWERHEFLAEYARAWRGDDG